MIEKVKELEKQGFRTETREIYLITIIEERSKIKEEVKINRFLISFVTDKQYFLRVYYLLTSILNIKLKLSLKFL